MGKLSAVVGGVIVFILIILPLLLVSAILQAYAIDLYWAWFITPVFVTLPALTLGKAYGLSMFVHLFFLNLSRYDHDYNEKTDLTDKAKYLAKKWLPLYPVIFLIGYIVHLIIS